MISSLSGVSIPQADQSDWVMVERTRNSDGDTPKLNADGGDRSATPPGESQADGSAGSRTPPAEEATSQADESTNGNNTMENLFQKLTSHFNPGYPLRPPFQFNSIVPFLASLQQQGARGMQADDSAASANFDPQMLGALVSAASSSNLDARAESVGSVDAPSIEPEDLSLREKNRNENDDGNSTNGASNWSFEEQFQQLYKLSNDPGRKEFLDDWLKFMQDSGKPVTRIPIMAKRQDVLDLYELYRLVTANGGLVEIINKKLWREITKGLNLPSSITSAAFTLRTQYQKYLYDYECARKGFSTHADLNAAVEGNKREGRRNNSSGPNGSSSTPLHNHPNGVFSYPTFPNAAAAAMSSLLGKHLNPFGLRANDDALGSLGANSPAFPAAYREQLGGLDTNPQQFDFLQRMVLNQSGRSGRDSNSSADSGASAKRPRVAPAANSTRNAADAPRVATPPARNPLGGLDQLLKSSAATHMKLTNNGDKSMVVSMEVNGVNYQGVLFAVNPTGGGENGTADPLSELFSSSGYES